MVRGRKASKENEEVTAQPVLRRSARLNKGKTSVVAVERTVVKQRKPTTRKKTEVKAANKRAPSPNKKQEAEKQKSPSRRTSSSPKKKSSSPENKKTAKQSSPKKSERKRPTRNQQQNQIDFKSLLKVATTIEERIEAITDLLDEHADELEKIAKKRAIYTAGEEVADVCGITGSTPGALMGETDEEERSRKKTREEKGKLGVQMYSALCVAYLLLMCAAFVDLIPVMDWEILSEDQVDWYSTYLKENMHIPCLLCLAYLVTIFGIQTYLLEKEPFDLKYCLSAWSFFLAVFSIVGSLRTVPVLMKLVWIRGWQHVVCGNTKNEWLVGNPAGAWTILFIFSKAPELIDTVFIVARKKRLIVLHVWHHVSVLVFCFHSLSTMCLNGIVYAAINLTVHALMYTFYGLTALGYRPKAFAMYITLVQILQMILGSACTLYVNYQIRLLGSERCSVDSTNAVAGLVMYGSYLYLFSSFFFHTYLKH